MIAFLERLSNVVSRAMGTAAGVMFFIMMFLISADIAGRYLFSAPITGALEITEMMLVVSVFLGLSYTESRGGHIRVSILHSRLPEPWQKGMNVLAYSLGIFLSVVMTWKTFTHALDLMQKTPWAGPQIPLGIPAMAIPLGFLLLLLHLCLYLIGVFANRKPQTGRE